MRGGLLPDSGFFMALYEPRDASIMARFDAVVMHPDTQLLDDSRYRDDAYRAMRCGHRGRPLSLVDAVLRAVIDDTNVALDALLTFNPADFADVCRQNSVAVL